MLATDFGQIANVLNGQLLGVQTRLTSTLNSYQSGIVSSIPLIGHSLGTSSQIINQFNDALKSSLSGLGARDSFTDIDIQTALVSGPLLPFVVDHNGDGAVGPDDVIVTHPANMGSQGFEVQLRLQAAATASPTVHFDTGLPALPMSVSAAGTVDVSVGFAFELAFTYNSTNQQVALDSTKTLSGLAAPDANHPIVDPLQPLAIFVTAGLTAGFSATTTVGFVQGTATPIAGQANTLYLTVMANNLTATPTLKLDGGANLNVRESGGFPGAVADFPAIDTDIHVQWAFTSANPAANRPVIKYDNVYLNLGKFISKVVGPIFKAIQDTTKPMEPVQKILREPLPGLSDLRQLVDGKDVTLLDIATVIAPYSGYGPLWDLIHNVGDLINAIDQMDIGDSVRLPLGGFDLSNYDLRGIGAAGDVSNLSLRNLTNFSIDNVQGLGKDFNQIVDELAVSDQAKDLMKKLVAGLNNGYKIDFPILNDPKQAIFDLLLGKDDDLFTLTVDEVVDSSGGGLPSFSVFGCGVEFGGEVHVDAHFKFAYDTFGMREMVNHLAAGDTTHIATDIRDGFYVSDDSHFKLSGGLFAGVSATYGIFSAKVGGFVSTDNHGDDPVTITINDPNHDGKLRFSEFGTGAFDTRGRFTAELGIEVRVGVTILGKFVGVKKHFDIATKVLIDLNPPDSNNTIPTGPILASQPDADGHIDLYIGADAGKRQQVDQTDGYEQLIIKHIDTTPAGETVEIAILEHRLLGSTYWVTQTITGVKSISGYGDLGDLTIEVLPKVTSDVHFEGGQGKATLTYSGSGAAYLTAGNDDSQLIGGSGSNTLFGGNGNDTLVLGSAVNIVGGGLGDNTIVITTPMTQGGLILGGSGGGNNTFVVLAGDKTTSISATPGSNSSFVDLHYQLAGAPPAPGLVLGQFSRFVISAQDRATNITVGDVSGAGVTQVFVSEPTAGATGRIVDLDARAGSGPSDLSLLPYVNAYADPNNPLHIIVDNALQFANATTGMTTYLLGMAGDDQTTIHQHGGTTTIGQLLKSDGNVTFDTSTRQAGQSESVTFSTPPEPAGNFIATHGNPNGDFRVNAIDYPTLAFHGMAPQDSATMNVTAPTQTAGFNVVNLDASTLVGGLVVNSQGGASASDVVTVSKVGSQGHVTVQGGNTSTAAYFGTGGLADIQGNVSINNAVLTIDNSLAQGSLFAPFPGGSIFTMTGTTFSGWNIPFFAGPAPVLSYSGLHGVLTVRAGAGDQFTLDATPASIASAVFNNATSSRDAVYISAWTAPLTLNGDFAMYLGERALGNGTVQRTKHLTGLANVPITLNFSTAIGSGTDVVFDGDLDPAGASYTIDGLGNLHVVNQTLGLVVTINGYRAGDQLHLLMPGGTVQADLTQTGPGTILVDGSARLAGTNASAANSIVVASRGASITLDPAGANDSVLQTFDRLHVLGSMPQDNFTVNVPTQTNVTNSVTIDASQLRGMLHVNVANPLAQVFSPFGLTSIILAAVNPLLAVFIVGTDPFSGGNTYAAAQTPMTFGASRLARIEGNVTVSKVVLTIDDTAATLPSNTTITATDASGWITDEPVPTPHLSYSNLYRDLTVNAGAGDRFELDHTPQAIDHIVLNNATGTQDAIYSTNWTVPIIANGNWSINLGWFLHPDGVVERIKNLVGLAIPVTLNFSGSPTGHVVLDGDSDPVGAQYVIDGSGNLHIVNQTVGLNVTINGYRAQDQAYIYLAGGTVAADLTRTGPGSFYVDGKSRLTGNHAAAANAISATVRSGSASLDALNTYDSVLLAFNTVNVLGSMPQDSFSVVQQTALKTAPRSQGRSQTVMSMWDDVGPFSYYSAVNPPPDYFVVLSTPYYQTVGHGEPRFLQGTSVQGYQLSSEQIDYYDTDLVYQGPTHTALVHVRVFPLNANPIAIDNHVNLDASQVRGTFSYRAAEPDYTLAEIFTADLNDNANYDGGANLGTTFGQTTVNLTKVNPELAVTITGTDPLSATHYTKLSNLLNLSIFSPVIHAAASELFVGAGLLANIQGNVAVHNLWLHEIDDRQGTAANNLILTATTLTGWATAGGVTHPTLSFDTLQGDLLLTGGPVDQFAVEDTPGSAYQTTIRNLATSGATPGVYVMGKTVMPLYVNGHFSVYAGRRLNADGTVAAVGQVGNLYNTADRFAFTGGTISTYYNGTIALHNLQLLNSGQFYTDSYVLPGVPLFDYMAAGRQESALPLFFTYAGSGQGTLVFDASNEVISSADIFGNNYIGLAANPDYPQQADLRFSKRIPNSTLFGDVIYGPNIELFDYGQRETTTFSSAYKYGPTVIFDNPLNAPAHYISNPNSSTIRWDEVVIGAAAGPVDVRGFDGLTRVTVDPKYSGHFSTFVNPSGAAPGWGANDRGMNVLSTIAADVTVSHAGLTIRSDVDGSAAPATLPPIVLTDNQITGIAGAPIHFSNLANSYTSDYSSSYIPSGQFPGLDLQLPGYGLVSATVQNTPSNVTTEIDTGTTAIGGLTVLGTTGPLFLANPNYGRSGYGTRPLFNFSAGSVVIGTGTAASIAGPIALGQDYHVTGDTTIDDRADPTPRQVSFSTSTQTLAPYTIDGLSPSSILVSTSIQSPHLAVYGPAGSQYKVMNGLQDTRLFAGLGSTVEFTNEPSKLYRPGMTVLGARSVLIDPRYDPANGLYVNFYNDYPITVSPDPARPTDATDLTINYAAAGNIGNAKLDSAGNGYDALFVNSGTLNVSYKADTTHLALSVDYPYGDNSFRLDVLDTGSAGTVIDSGGLALNVKSTTGPLEIHQSGGGIVTLGNAGNLQGIHGSVSIVANDPAKPRLATTIDDTADAAARTVTVSQDGAGNSAIGGLTTIPVTISGSQFDLTLKGGTGSNRLIGPNLNGAWSISSAGGGRLNHSIIFTGFATLQGGSQNDNFFFTPGGALAGDLDGGGGTNTLYYQTGMLGGSEVIDLPNHKAPRIAGMVLNIQGSNTFPALTISTPGDLISGTYYLRERGGPVSPVTIASSGGFGTKVYSAVGLPSGVAFDPQTGAISGFNNNDSYFAQVVMSVTDDTGTVSTNFYWQTLPGIVVTTPANQNSNVGSTVNVPIQVSNNYGTALTYSYDPQYGAFPAGLSVNPQSGTISGTFAGDANLNSPYYVRIVATDGVHTGGSNPFNWTVLSGLTISTPANQTSAAGSVASLPVQVSNNYGTTLTYSVIGNLPAGLSINSQTGLISGTIAAGASASSPYSFRVLASDSYHAAETNYVYWTVKSFLVSSPGNRNIPEGTPINFSLDTDLPIVNPAHTPLTFAVYFYGNSAADQSHGYIRYDSAARAITGALPNGWISTDSRLLTIDARVFDANTNDFQDVFFNWSPVPGFSVSSFLGDRTNQVRDPVSVYAASISNPAGHSFSLAATGLPAGLTIDPGTGLISGTVADNADAGSPFHVTVTVVDATYGADGASASFQWTVMPGITITHVANQSSQIGNQISLAIQAMSVFGQPLTYSAQGLPAGLSINAQTGLISGTIADGSDSGSPYHTVLTASDGTHSASAAFQWTVRAFGQATIEGISWVDLSLGPPGGNDDSEVDPASSVVSADGRYVAFYSSDANIVPGDTNGGYDVFIRDRQTGTTTLVSAGVSGPENGESFSPSISADGRYVAFYSYSTNLVPGGTNGYYQVFVHDMQAGTTTLASTGPNGQGNNYSYYASISANGRYVAFISGATNLTPDGTNGRYQVYVRDLVAGTTTLVSTGPNGQANSNTNETPSISADGRDVAFSSSASNLVAGTSGSQIYVRDLQASTTTLVSAGVNGPANNNSSTPAISADGQHVAFTSAATNLVNGIASYIYRVYESDWQTGMITLVSVDSTGHDANGNSTDPTISATGRYVAFDSRASNLVDSDTNGRYDVFVRDRRTGATTRVSVGPAAEADNDSYYPSMSSDGRYIAFVSNADNLVPGFTTHRAPDIYLDYNPTTVPDLLVPPNGQVTNASDSGPGSLRQALLDAAASPGSSHTITFALPAGGQTITLNTTLPSVADPLVLSLDATQNVKVTFTSPTSLNNAGKLTTTGAGKLTFGGGIDGAGSVTVNSGSSLTTVHIVQSSLVIGGTAGAPAIVTIAPSDASGNPLTIMAVSPSTASIMAAATTIDSTTASSPIPIAEAPTTQSVSGSALAAKESSSDTAGLIARQAATEIPSLSNIANSASIETDRALSHATGIVYSTSDQPALQGQQVAATNGTSGMLHRDAVAAAFDDADIREWLGSADTSRSSASDAESTYLADDLLAAIGQQWRN